MARRLGAVFWRATLSAIDAARKMAVVQIKAMGGQTLSEIEHAEPYGFSSCATPGDGVEVFGANVGAASDHPVAICVAWRAKRPVDLADQDVTVYDARGNRLWMRAAGVYMTGALVDITGPTTVHGLLTATGAFAAPSAVIAGALGFGSLSGGGGISGGAGVLAAPTINATVAFQANGVPGFTGVAGPGSTITFAQGIATGVV